MESIEPYVAHTHREWFDHLSRHAVGGRLDEVNFWSPKAQTPPKAFGSGEPVFFRLGAPVRAIAGYGFFASFNLLPLSLAWDTFNYRNGAVDRSSFFRLLGRLTAEDLALPVGCMILLGAHFWPEPRWIPWGAERGWTSGIQRGRGERAKANADMLLATLGRDAAETPLELLSDPFSPLDVDERKVALAEQTVREGQGAFRLRLLDAYGGACAITGEHTEPVLDAAHIQRYLGPKSNHPCNGLILTKEFHALFDKGLVTIQPPGSHGEYRVHVSKLIHERWKNGRRYNDFDGRTLVSLPRDRHLLPSPEALAWHREKVFERVA